MTNYDKLLEEYGITLEEQDIGQNFTMMSAMSEDGGYIGDRDNAISLVKRGIKPMRNNGSDGCSIGWNEKEQKWYGWSHRAIYGFGVGSSIKDGDAGFEARGAWTAKTLEDAKQMAINFAEDVS